MKYPVLFAFRMSEELYKALAKEAAEEDRSVAWLIRMAIVNELNRLNDYLGKKPEFDAEEQLLDEEKP